MAGLVIRRAAAVCVALGLSLAAVPGRAAPPPPDPKVDPGAADMEEARRLFENGEALFDDASYDAAIQAFRRAFALSGASSCLYNIALAYDRMDDFDGAIEYLQYYRVYATDPDLEELADKTADLQRRKQDAQDAQVDDDDDQDQDQDQALVPDPPPPSVRVFGPGAIAATAIAVVGVGVGIGLGGASLRRGKQADDACALDPDGDRFCGPQAADPIDTSRRLALGADIAFGVGAAAAVAAIVIVAVRASRNKRARTALVPARRGAGLAIRF